MGVEGDIITDEAELGEPGRYPQVLEVGDIAGISLSFWTGRAPPGRSLPPPFSRNK